jgi:ribosome-binding protein aMBF1 (putative translation factor)
MTFEEYTRKLQRPYAGRPLLKLLDERIEASGRSRREIASDLGYDKVNILTMFTRGETAIPIDRAIKLGDVLGIDLTELVEAGAETYPDHAAWTAARMIVRRLRPPEPLPVA